MNTDYLINAKKEYDRWLKNTSDNQEIQKELLELSSNHEEMIDSFYKGLKFGTSGIRGIIGPGTNRINEYVIRRVTQGLSNYLNDCYETPSVIVGYDTRKNSKLYAEETAAVLAGNGIKAYIFSELATVSFLSYSIEKMNCTMGIMITASHNSKIYNGYKVYNSDGYQIVGDTPTKILEEINKVDYFDGIKKSNNGIEFINEEITEEFINEITSFSMLKNNKPIMNDINIIYTPLNGTGRYFVQEVFKRVGFNNCHTVSIQENPDKNFSTCTVPNPEKITAYNEGFKTMDQIGGDIIIATDPDCDRVGVAMYYDDMKVLLTGNQLGILMFDYLCQMQPPKAGQMVITSIVTTPLVEKICEKYNINVKHTLTGFKYIGEIITQIKKKGIADSYFFAFEESNGYLIKPFISDKDGVSSALLAAETAAFNKAKGRNLIQRLQEIHKEYGLCIDKSRSYFFEGPTGQIKIAKIMDYFRKNIDKTIGEYNIVNKIDYMNQNVLPKENVIQFDLENSTRFIIRPSGTEPKLKVYLFESEREGKVEKTIKDIIDRVDNNIEI